MKLIRKIMCDGWDGVRQGEDSEKCDGRNATFSRVLGTRIFIISRSQTWNMRAGKRNSRILATTNHQLVNLFILGESLVAKSLATQICAKSHNKDTRTTTKSVALKNVFRFPKDKQD